MFSTLRSLLRARLIAKMPWNYVDATNLSPHERRQSDKMAKSFGYDVQAVFFDVPLEVCMERNRRRERTVSDDVMKKMAERLRAAGFQGRVLEDHGGAGEGCCGGRRRDGCRRGRVVTARPRIATECAVPGTSAQIVGCFRAQSVTTLRPGIA